MSEFPVNAIEAAIELATAVERQRIREIFKQMFIAKRDAGEEAKIGLIEAMDLIAP
jgi:hypothetical protein